MPSREPHCTLPQIAEGFAFSGSGDLDSSTQMRSMIPPSEICDGYTILYKVYLIFEKQRRKADGDGKKEQSTLMLNESSYEESHTQDKSPAGAFGHDSFKSGSRP